MRKQGSAEAWLGQGLFDSQQSKKCDKQALSTAKIYNNTYLCSSRVFVGTYDRYELSFICPC
jgi:hypothetical protein